MDDHLTRTLVNGLFQTLVPTTFFGVVAIGCAPWWKLPVSRRAYDRALGIYLGWLVGYLMALAVWGYPKVFSWYHAFSLVALHGLYLGMATFALRPDDAQPA